MHQGFKKVIETLQLLQFAKDELDLNMEVNRLHAIVDGMAMHHVLNSKQLTQEKMIQTLNYHLQSLCK